MTQQTNTVRTPCDKFETKIEKAKNKMIKQLLNICYIFYQNKKTQVIFILYNLSFLINIRTSGFYLFTTFNYFITNKISPKKHTLENIPLFYQELSGKVFVSKLLYVVFYNRKNPRFKTMDLSNPKFLNSPIYFQLKQQGTSLPLKHRFLIIVLNFKWMILGLRV